MKTRYTQNVRRMVGIAVLAALIVVLQMIAAITPTVGGFRLTFSLVPLIIGAIIYGPLAGAILGGAFGLIVVIQVVTGIDVGGFLMFQQNPVITLLVCMIKGIVAGYVAGLVSKLLKEKQKPVLTVTLSAILCPICNTGILSIAVLTFFRDLAYGWGVAEGFTNVFAYVILGMVGVNFLLELAINLLLTPALLTIIKAVRRQIAR